MLHLKLKRLKMMCCCVCQCKYKITPLSEGACKSGLMITVIDDIVHTSCVGFGNCNYVSKYYSVKFRFCKVNTPMLSYSVSLASWSIVSSCVGYLTHLQKCNTLITLCKAVCLLRRFYVTTKCNVSSMFDVVLMDYFYCSSQSLA